MSATQKYFLAIIPPEPLFKKVEELKKTISETYNTKASLRSPAHITLHMPFEWKEDKENELLRKLNEFKFENKFTVELRNFSSFAPKVLFIDVVPNQSLQDLQKKLVQHVKARMNIFNESDNLRAFHPHMTIAFRDLRKHQFQDAWEIYRPKSFSASFDVSGYWLLKHDGKRWNKLHAFKF